MTFGVVGDVVALALACLPRRHRHVWLPSDYARGDWPSEADLDVCAVNPRHTRRRP